jgi:hypothetical protein
MEKPTHISEMGIHTHPGYSWEFSCADRREGPMDPSAVDSLLETSHSARPTNSTRKPILGECRILESAEGGSRNHLRRVS